MVLAPGDAAVTLTVSQLVPEINVGEVHSERVVRLTFQRCILPFKKIWLVNCNRRHNIAVVKLSIGHICFESILSALYRTKWCLEAGIIQS